MTPDKNHNLYESVRSILDNAYQNVYRAANTGMVSAYWQVGRLIVEEEQNGATRADYGKKVLKELSEKLIDEFGKGYSQPNLRNFRQFYLVFPEICSISSDSNSNLPKRYTVCSELSWSHFCLLMRVENKNARDFYLKEASSQNWSVRALDRQIYNYILKCFVLIDLKIEKLTHQDVGQMDMYVRLFEEKVKQADDNPTIGIILCSQQNESVIKYSVLTDNKQLFSSKYKLYLPTEEELKNEIERDRIHIENELREQMIKYQTKN